MTMPEDAEIDEACRLEMALLQPEIRADREALDRLLHPEFQEFGASGTVWTREATIEALARGAAGEVPIECSQLVGKRIGPGVILVTYATDQAGRRALRSSLWVHFEGAWRILFHQGTLRA